MQIILDLLSCDLTISIDQSYRADRNKIANERQDNNDDIRIDRQMCTFVIKTCIFISLCTLIFENLRGGGVRGLFF